MKLGLTALRATLGAVFFAHGVQKLFGWFGGHGLEATAGAFDSMGLRPGKRTARSPAPRRPAAARCWASACSRRWVRRQ